MSQAGKQIINYKLIARTVICSADADLSITWLTPYVGVVDSAVPSQSVARLMWDVIEPRFVPMCTVIGGISKQSVEEGVRQIRQVESGEVLLGSTGNDALSAIFDQESAKFWCEYGFGKNYPNIEGTETTGEVTFDEFKFALETYLQFLSDPFRRSIEVVFPTGRSV